jgi:hypothetical protein
MFAMFLILTHANFPFEVKVSGKNFPLSTLACQAFKSPLNIDNSSIAINLLSSFLSNVLPIDWAPEDFDHAATRSPNELFGPIVHDLVD